MATTDIIRAALVSFQLCHRPTLMDLSLVVWVSFDVFGGNVSIIVVFDPETML